MASPIVQPMPPFDPDVDIGQNIAPRWKIWIEDFQTYLVANGITDKKRQRALLLYQAGPRVREIFRQLPDTGEDDDIDTAIEKLNSYFEPQKHRLYEVYKFRQTRQEVNESIDQYYTRLRSMGKRCEFADIDFEIMLQIVLHGTSKRLRKQALRDPKMTLKDLLIIGKQFEMCDFQTADIEDNNRTANEVNALRNEQRSKVKSECRNCGGEWPHIRGNCPAKGKECRNCGKLNHFAKSCRSAKQEKRETKLPPQRRNKIRPVDVTDDDSDSSGTSGSHSPTPSYCYAVETQRTNNPVAKVKINNQYIKFTVDTGSTINIIDPTTFDQLGNVTLVKTHIKAFPFNSTTPVKMKGKFCTEIESRRKITVANIYVTDGNGGCLLSGSTAQELGLISLHLNTVNTSPTKQAEKDKTLKNEVVKDVPIDDHGVQKIVRKYSNAFQGLGKLKDKQIDLIIDKDVKPVAQQQRRVPFHLREKVEKELQQLYAQDIIEKVPENEETEWISPLVIVPKQNDKIRLCVDMRAANEAIKRVRHPIPTVKDVCHELNGAKFFTKLDLSQAYHQIELSPQSRYITTFATHQGLYRYKRLNYGTNSAAEIFQHTLQQVFQGMKGVKNIADDILVFGPTYQAHNEALAECLRRIQTHGLTLNLSKCLFLKQNLEFFGLVFTKDGVRPDPKKVSAFKNSSTPSNASEVRSLLGMANYSAQFIPNFATITEPLRQLTRKDTKFQWTSEHENAYQTLKEALINSPVMSYFDTNKETLVLVDASPVGLSAILSQRAKGSNNAQIIAYGSRALTSTEKRYSQTEKEALAIVWGIEHFHLYLYGASFTLYTDHKPLELIYANPVSKPPARIERWMLRLQQYSFTVIYKAGADNPADFLSRHPLPTGDAQHNIAEEYVNFLTNTSVPNALTVTDISKATDADRSLCALRTAIQSGKWNDPLVQPYKSIKEELCVDHQNNVILRGARIIIPPALQQKVVQLAHEGHQGQAKTKALLREHVWFPGMDYAVKKEIQHCLACQASLPANPPEPLGSSPMPRNPWEKVKIDFYGPLPSGHYLLVVIDCYSRFPETAILKSISAQKVIPQLDEIFARHGIPMHLTSDNGPPFQSHEFSRYMTALGIEHTTSTPLWPQGNAEAEAFMKPLGKAIKTAHAERRPWQQELAKFLLNYRQTPHSTTGVPPAQLLFNRATRGKLPSMSKEYKLTDRHNEARENEERKKTKGRNYADTRRRTRHSKIEVGDRVLVKQTRHNKLSTNFSTTPYTVVKITGSRVVAENNHHRITRNLSFFRRIPEDILTPDDEEDSIPDTRGVADTTPMQENQPVRRSTRNRRPAERYGQPIDSSIIR